jgi:hypothetical protein
VCVCVCACVFVCVAKNACSRTSSRTELLKILRVRVDRQLGKARQPTPTQVMTHCHSFCRAVRQVGAPSEFGAHNTVVERPQRYYVYVSERVARIARGRGAYALYLHLHNIYISCRRRPREILR